MSGLPRNDWLVEFTQDAHLVFEGGATVVGLRLDDAADRDFTVPIVAIPEGGASAADYSLPESVTFEEGKVEASFTLTAIADGVSDPGESVRLSLGSLPEALSPGGRAETVVSIFDGLVVRAGFVEESFAGAEGDTVRVRVGLSQDPGREVTIPIVATPQDGASEDDYSGLPESVTFQPGEIEASFLLTVTDDGVDDDGESLLLELGELPTGVTTGTGSARTTVLLDDDDAPTALEVNYGRSAYNVGEGGSVTVELTLSDDPERQLTIPVQALRLGTTEASDFSLSANSIVFGPGERTKTFTVSATSDSSNDDGEQLNLGIGSLSVDLPQGVTRGDRSIATVTINERLVLVSNLGQTVSGGAPLTKFISFDIDDGYAIWGVPRQRLGFMTGTHPSGYNLHSVRVMISQSSVSDSGVSATADEPLNARLLQGGSRVALLTVPSGSLEDIEVLTAPAGTKLLPNTRYQVELWFDSDPGLEDVAIPITSSSAPDAGAEPGWDMPSGGNARLLMQLRGSKRPIPTGVLVNFDAGAYTVSEGAQAEVTVSLSKDADRTVVVPITVTEQGDASGADYSGLPRSVTFQPGETETSFMIDAVQDVADDDGESLVLRFGELPSGIEPGSTTTATVSITDDDENDGQTVTLSFDESSYEIFEDPDSDRARGRVSLRLDAIPGREVNVPIVATPQNGATDLDYSGVPESVTFEADETTTSFWVRTEPDGINDDGESVLLEFGTLPANVQAGSMDSTVVNIRDDDSPVTNVGFEQDAYEAPEGSVVKVRLLLSDPPGRAVDIPILAIGRNGAAADDYQVDKHASFLAHQTSVTFDFVATDDNDDDDGQSVQLTFGPLPPGISTHANQSTTVNIIDNDQVVEFGADLLASTLTTGVVTVDTLRGAATHARSSIEVAGDVDWFRVILTSGRMYRFALKGRDAASGRTLENPIVVGIYTGSNQYVDGTLEVPLLKKAGGPRFPTTHLHYMATMSGPHWVSVRGYRNETGIYDLRILELEDDLMPDNRDTPGTINLGQTKTGSLDYRGDRDWFSAELQANTPYAAEITGSKAAPCTRVIVYSSKQRENPIYPSPACSSTKFEVSEAGTYYLVVESYFRYGGTYSLTLRQEDP